MASNLTNDVFGLKYNLILDRNRISDIFNPEKISTEVFAEE